MRNSRKIFNLKKKKMLDEIKNLGDDERRKEEIKRNGQILYKR